LILYAARNYDWVAYKYYPSGNASLKRFAEMMSRSAGKSSVVHFCGHILQSWRVFAAQSSGRPRSFLLLMTPFQLWRADDGQAVLGHELC
jgi:hypothetical protein